MNYAQLFHLPTVCSWNIYGESIRSYIIRYKCNCGFIGENSHSVSTQKRYCTKLPPEEHSRLFKCHHSKFSTGLESGLWVHLSRVHPSLYNEKLKEKTKNILWSEPEFRLLAETILDLKSKKVRDVNQAVSKLLGRSLQAIQKIRTKTE